MTCRDTEVESIRYSEESDLSSKAANFGSDAEAELSLPSRKSQSEQSLLFQFVSLGRTRRGARAGRAFDRPQRQITGKLPDAGQNVKERPHIRRLLLHPDDFPRLSVARQLGAKFSLWKRIKLIEEDDGSFAIATPIAFHAQFVADFPSTNQNPLRTINFPLWNDIEEPIFSKICDWGR